MPTSDMDSLPLVSAVIPTRNRPQEVVRAVESVFAQTWPRLEAVVVIDGKDDATETALAAIKDSRLRVTALTENVGGSEARNIGVREARGEWIAFLDDDDEWLPGKIKAQMERTQVRPEANFVVCRFEERNSNLTRVMPRDFPRVEEDWSEYIYCRGGLLLPSTYLVRRTVLLQIGFTKGLAANQDTDWLLRARQANLLKPDWIEEPFTIYHNESEGQRVSSDTAWKTRYQWARENQTLLTKRSFSWYVARICVPNAKRSGAPLRNCLFLTSEAVLRGAVSARAYFYLLQSLFTSPRLRRKVRVFMDRYAG